MPTLVIDKVDWEKALDVPMKVWNVVSVQWMEELRDFIVDMCSTEGGFIARSKPGEYPYKQTGRFTDGLNVGLAGGPKDFGKIGLYSEAPYGKALQIGIGMEPRPWLTLALENCPTSSTWGSRMVEMMKEMLDSLQ